MESGRSTTAPTEETYSDAELQIVRVKLDIIRARMGAALELIPAGREYDTPPDALDDVVQPNALEKKADETFVGSPVMQMTPVHGHEAFAQHKDTMGYYY